MATRSRPLSWATSKVRACFKSGRRFCAFIDPDVSIGWMAAVVPFVSRWDPVWVGLGALAGDQTRPAPVVA